MVCEDTLRVKNLPHDLSDDEKKDFLRHFGAKEVKVITSKAKQRSIVYAKFDSADVAKAVLLRLHQLTVLNARLCVEYAENDIGNSLPKIQTKDSVEASNKKHFKAFVNRLNALNNSVSFNQPPPSHLKYIYPKPNRATINNIAHALASIPKFYTQVLHLMNRMNLPPPFSDIPDPQPAMARQKIEQPINSQNNEKKPKEDSEESEIESDNEENTKEIIPTKRTFPHKKVVKRPKFIKPSNTQGNAMKKTGESTDDVFETVDIQKQKKIDVFVAADTLDQKLKTENANTENNVGSFGLIDNSEKIEDENKEATNGNNAEEDATETKVITDSELAANRIELKDTSVLPVFKNYHPGSPSCRLYVKNIAKSVESSDLEFIFKRYQVSSEDPEKPSQFDIRLMQEGRMKGQAFITLDSVELAQQAVKETNGFILKNKPIVVVFARSAVPKK